MNLNRRRAQVNTDNRGHFVYFLTADDGAQSHVSGGRVHVDCHASRLRAHACQRTGIRGRALQRRDSGGS
ncbi:MAG: hypothetical protein LUQ20_05120 [Candidatus Methanoperedens sp.]|nr:hypothetical protein [Candidatus Methanoperedens sp.]